MSLLDTIDGSFMNFAYGWAFSKPVRKVYYNLTITGLSVVVALVIGTIELLGLLADSSASSGGPAGLRSADSTSTSSASSIVGLFVATWVGRAGGLALRPHRGEVERRARGDSGG